MESEEQDGSLASFHLGTSNFGPKQTSINVSPLSEAERKLYFGAVRSPFDPQRTLILGTDPDSFLHALTDPRPNDPVA